jgi:lactate dehydrogenase-like 2-hydroxyacid dehydrogenase
MYNKIVSVDFTGMIPEVKEELSKLAKEVVYYDDYPTDKGEIISRIKDADVILVSWNTKLTKEMLDECHALKYVGMCCSLIDESSANVDVTACRSRGIPVLGVRDYGDEGVAEFIMSELIKLTHGFGDHQWKDGVHELYGHKLGIVGLGATGLMVAERAKAFGMEVYYYSRTKKDVPYHYLELNELIKTVDMLSTHLPRHIKVLEKEHLELFGTGKVLINTSLGPTFDVEAFKVWIKEEGNYSIMDYEAMGVYRDEFTKIPNLITSNKVSGWTEQAKVRLSWKVLENIKSVL